MLLTCEIIKNIEDFTGIYWKHLNIYSAKGKTKWSNKL